MAAMALPHRWPWLGDSQLAIFEDAVAGHPTTRKGELMLTCLDHDVALGAQVFVVFFIGYGSPNLSRFYPYRYFTIIILVGGLEP